MISSRILTKLFVAIGSTIVVSAVVVGIFESRRIRGSVQENAENTLREQAAMLAELARGVLEAGTIDASFQGKVERLGRETAVRFTVIDADGVVLADSRSDPRTMENHGSRPEVFAVRDRAREVVVERYSETLGRRMLYFARGVYSGDKQFGYARTSRDLDEIEAQVRYLERGMVVSVAVIALLACLVAFLVARHLTGPLRAMTAAVSEMAAGDVSRRVMVQTADEFGDLARAFNSLAEQLNHRIDVLAKERQQVVATLRSMVEGVIVTDEDQRVLFLNDSARQMLAIDSPDVVGQALWELTRIGTVGEILESTIRDGTESAEEVVLAGRHGDRVFEVRSTSLRSENELVRGAVLVFHEVTELRRLEQVRRDFVSNVSHELKTPLTAIRGFAETLLDDVDAGEAVRTRFLTKIREQCKRLQSMVSDQLTLARVESKEAPRAHERVDFRSIVDHSIGLVENIVERKGIEMTIAKPDSPIVVEGDPELLRQVVDNLVDNAVKYTPEGGFVRIGLVAEASNVLFSVEDSGIGLTIEDQQRVFERFYRADRARSRDLGGTGLGLSIARNVVVSHGGEISVTSELGRGSEFTVRLPLHAHAAKTHAKS